MIGDDLGTQIASRFLVSWVVVRDAATSKSAKSSTVMRGGGTGVSRHGRNTFEMFRLAWDRAVGE